MFKDCFLNSRVIAVLMKEKLNAGAQISHDGLSNECL